MTREHNCLDHLEYDSNDLDEQWYRCTICFRIYPVEQVDRMLEAEATR